MFSRFAGGEMQKQLSSRAKRRICFLPHIGRIFFAAVFAKGEKYSGAAPAKAGLKQE